MISTMAERLLVLDEVSQRLGVSVYTLRLWLREGRLPGFRMGGSKLGWRVREADLDRFIERLAGSDQAPE
jgi:excisionase family DNA binding protein